MNKKNSGKLAIFLKGLEDRIERDFEYFQRIEAIFRSGTKEYKALLSLENQKLKLNYNGHTEFLEISWLSARLSKIAEVYDSARIVFYERGTSLIIEADDRNVRMLSGGNTSSDKKQVPHNDVSQIGSRDYLIKVGEADELLKEIGILAENGKVRNDRIRKYNQIDHFVELVRDILEEASRETEILTVLDLGCGKSYLSFVLNYYIREIMKKNCHFIGIDYSEKVVEASRSMASNLGYRNMEFRALDIKDFRAKGRIDLVISLHACDTATDEALAIAVNNGVKNIVVVPCCHKELMSQMKFMPLESIFKHGILKARFADDLTEGLRALLLEAMGYKVSVVEYISPLETPKNLMIRAQKVQGPNARALKEFMELKNLMGFNLTFERLLDRLPES